LAFIIRIYHDTRSSECQKSGNLFGKGLLECNNVLLTLPFVIAMAEDEFDLLNSGEF
jgi:hypothetical protein